MSVNYPIANYALVLGLLEDNLDTSITEVNSENSGLGLRTVGDRIVGAKPLKIAWPTCVVRVRNARHTRPTTEGVVSGQSVEVILADNHPTPATLEERMRGYATALLRAIVENADDSAIDVQIEVVRLIIDPAIPVGVTGEDLVQRVGLEVVVTRGEDRR